MTVLFIHQVVFLVPPLAIPPGGPPFCLQETQMLGSRDIATSLTFIAGERLYFICAHEILPNDHFDPPFSFAVLARERRNGNLGLLAPVAVNGTRWIPGRRTLAEGACVRLSVGICSFFSLQPDSSQVVVPLNFLNRTLSLILIHRNSPFTESPIFRGLIRDVTKRN